MRVVSAALRLLDATWGLSPIALFPRRLVHADHRCELIPFTFGCKPFDEDRFVNVRMEMWWNLGEKLREGKLRLPRDPALFEQLSGPQMLQDSRGRLRLESKDSMRKRGIRSPDLADALALACYPDEWFLHMKIW